MVRSEQVPSSEERTSLTTVDDDIYAAGTVRVKYRSVGECLFKLGPYDFGRSCHFDPVCFDQDVFLVLVDSHRSQVDRRP